MRVYYVVNMNLLRIAVRKWNQNSFIFIIILFCMIFLSFLFVLFGAPYKTRTVAPYAANHILFRPTHSHGSREIQNVLFRRALTRRLNLALPHTGVILDQSDVSISKPKSSNDFHIIAHRMKIKDPINTFLLPQTKRITILENPITSYEIRINQQFEKLKDNVLRNHPNSIEQFNKMHSQDKFSEVLMNENITDPTLIISHLEQNYDLILISEQLEASLVMMAGLLSWPLLEVSFLPLSPPRSLTIKLTPQERNKVRNLHAAEVLVYRHFEAKFRAQVLQYGGARMERDVKKLMRINEKLQQDCVWTKQIVKPIKIIKDNDSSRAQIPAHCEYFLKNETEFTDLLRKEQKYRFQVLKEFQDLMDN